MKPKHKKNLNQISNGHKGRLLTHTENIIFQFDETLFLTHFARHRFTPMFMQHSPWFLIESKTPYSGPWVPFPWYVFALHYIASAIFGYLRLSSAFFGFLQFFGYFLVILGAIWLSSAIFSYLRLFLVILGYFWLSWAIFGYIRLLLS